MRNFDPPVRATPGTEDRPGVSILLLAAPGDLARLLVAVLKPAAQLLVNCLRVGAIPFNWIVAVSVVLAVPFVKGGESDPEIRSLTVEKFSGLAKSEPHKHPLTGDHLCAFAVIGIKVCLESREFCRVVLLNSDQLLLLKGSKGGLKKLGVGFHGYLSSARFFVPPRFLCPLPIFLLFAFCLFHFRGGGVPVADCSHEIAAFIFDTVTISQVLKLSLAFIGVLPD